MQHVFSKSHFFLFALLSMTTALDSCKKETDTSSPAYHIRESEKLVIPAAIDLPANLPGGNTRIATFFARGVQKYKAQQRAGSNPVSYEWVLVAPQATLYDAANKKAGSHTAGPTWQLSGAADSIYGQQFSPPKSAASPDASGIDWLQLMPRTGKPATGIFASVSYIQRIATTGGKAPATLPVAASDTADVAYTAVYRFSKKNS